MELVELGRLTAAQKGELEGEEANPWGGTGAELEWRPKDHHVALHDADGSLVAVAGWLITDIAVAGQLIQVVGIGGVMVAERLRGRGLGRRLIAEAITRAEKAGPEIAMLFCQPDRVGLYERHGFAVLAEPVQVKQPLGSVEIPMETMWRPLAGGASLPPGPVRVPGLPF